VWALRAETQLQEAKRDLQQVEAARGVVGSLQAQEQLEQVW
jgi:hypothetical protein